VNEPIAEGSGTGRMIAFEAPGVRTHCLRAFGMPRPQP